MFAKRSISRIVSVLFNVVLILSLLVGAIAFPTSVHATGIYILTDLGTLGTSSFATAINEAGQVIGFSFLSNGEQHGFVWDDGAMTDLTLGGSSPIFTSVAAEINEAGQVVGYARTPGGETHAFLWEAGVITDLGTLGGNNSIATAISESGQVVGSARTASGVDHAFLWESGVMTDLGTLGGTYSSPIAINEAGQIIGNAETASGEQHAFLWENGVMIDLGTLGGNLSTPIAINEAGQVIGDAKTATGESHAFMWENGVMIDLGTLGGSFSTPIAINESGQISGGSSLAGNAISHAFVWDDGVMTDLGTLSGGSGAIAINEAGQVIGFSATAAGEDHAFMWENGVMIDLGTFGGDQSIVYDINEAGQVVGAAKVTPVEFHAFVWKDGVMTDMGTLGGDSSTAYAINESGQIVGQAKLANNDAHAFIAIKELIPPTVLSIVLASPNPPTASSVDFTVTFSESVTGVNAGDFALRTTTGISGGAIGGVNGSGSTYTVSVNTGTGSGTIRLDVVDDDSIIDAASNPLGGVGAGNGNFTGIESYDKASLTVNTIDDDTTPDAFCSLREAITNANNDAQTYPECGAGNGNDEINFDDALGANMIVLTSALPDITDPDGLTINGGGDMIMDGANEYRVFFVSFASLTLDSLTVQSGYSTSDGAGIYINDGTLSLNDSLVMTNWSGSRGGGIYNIDGTLTLNNSTVRNNYAVMSGGGIENYFGELMLNNSTVSDNSAATGGGIMNDGGGLTILNNSTISGNSAEYAGGISNSGQGTLELNYSTVANNASDKDNNTVGEGGGIYLEGGPVNLKSSIVAGNKKGTSGVSDATADCTSAQGEQITSQGYNLSSQGTGCILEGTGDMVVNPVDVFTTVLGALADNGGATQTHALMGDSIALDRIPNGINDCGAGLFNYDQRGEPRPLSTQCDIGAYEAEFTLTPILYAQPGGLVAGRCNTWVNACELRYALSIAVSGQEIWVAAGTYKPTSGTDRTATFTLKNGVAIYGGFVGTETLLSQRDAVANVTILSGDLNGNDGANFANNGDNSYHVVMGSGTNNTAVLDGFTITAGNANGGSFPLYNGGGMLNMNGSPGLENLMFNANTATNGGGGIYNNDGSPSLTNVTFNNNSASVGGGMYNIHSSSPSLITVSFSGNSALNHGGGIFNSTNSSPTLTEVIFINNTVGGNGGGMSNYNSSNPILSDVTFDNNSAFNGGGGMYNYNSNPALTNVTFSGNSAAIGGGLFNENISNPTLMDVIFDNNTASSGGGGMINWINSSPTLTNVIFSNNTATSYGGGIFNYSSSNPVLSDVTFSGNSAFGGGGMANELSNPTLTDVTFSDNTANTGGGMYSDSANPILTNVAFSDNAASVYGGGMWNLNNQPSLTDVTFNNNTATLGGGIFNEASNLSLTNVTFNANIAISGGGMYNINGSNPSLTNVTFSNNTTTAGDGGGMFNDASNPSLTNVTFSGNTVANTGGSYYGSGIFNDNSAPAIKNSIFWDSGTDIFNNGPLATPIIDDSIVEDGCPDAAVCNNIINVDPLLGALADNGGFTQTMALGVGSPAIDAGNDTTCATTDQRGVTRPQGVHCDIGAFEAEDNTPAGIAVQVQPVDTTTGTSPVTLTFDQVTQSGQTSLTTSTTGPAVPSGFSLGTPPTYYELSTTATFVAPVTVCINYAGISFGNEADLTLNHYEGGSWVDQTISLDTANDVICGTVNSLSPFAIFEPETVEQTITVTTISDNVTTDSFCSLREAITNANDDAATYADCIAGSGNDTIVFDNALGTATITLTSALPNISDADGLTINGGGDITISGANTYRLFYVDYYEPSISLILDSLTVANGNANYGGGVFNNYGTLTISNSIFSGNHAGSGSVGGGVYNQGGTLNITNSVFSGNSSTNWGGGINNQGTLTIMNSTFSGNSATIGGGGIENGPGMTTIIVNSTFFDNTANYGGGVFNHGTLTITNSTFSGNTATSLGSGVINEDTLNLYNTILANSTSNRDCFNNGGTVNGNNNLIEATGSNACELTNGTNGNIIGFDPNLDAQTGSPAYFPLNSDSYALDTGNDAICAATPVNNISQNEAIRPQGTHCDMGSFEFPSGDITSPTVSSITRANINPTNAASVDFTVTFSEFVTGVDTSDFALTITGITGTSITGVSGSGAMYTVSVDTGSGDGTIRLDVNDEDSILDVSSNPLGGAGVGNGDFTNGESYTKIAQLSTRYVATTGVDTGYCNAATTPCATITYAILQAFAGNTIEIAAGIYTEAGITIDKDLTLIGAGATNTIVQAATSPGTAIDRVLHINTDITVTIDSMTIRYGNISTYTGGGGISNFGTLTLNNSMVSENSAYLGSGIYNLGMLTLNNSTVNDNSGTIEGATGGGIYNSNELSGALTLNNSTVSGNSVAYYGGGIYNTGALTLNNSTVNGNSAGIHGGGLRNNGPTATMMLNNSTVSGNSANAYGGGISIEFGTVTLNYSSVTNNVSDNDNNGFGDGGGILNGGGTANLKSSIVAGNKKGTGGIAEVTADCSNISSAITSQGYNLTGNGTGCNLSGTGDMTVTPANVFTDVLDALGVNGGATQTHALIVSSSNPALNVIPSGTNDCGIAPFDLDQRGEARPFNTNCDIGAYEAQSAPPTTVDQTITVTTNAPASAIYGSNFTVEATASSGLPVTYSSAGACTNDGADFTMTSGTGTCTVMYDQAGDASYNPAPRVIESVTALPAEITVFANDQSKVYGNPDLLFSLTYMGFVGGDGASDIDVQPTCGVTEAHVNVGSYPITCSGGVDDNYTFNYVDGTLTVTKAILTVFANNQSKVYGNPDLLFSLTYMGFVGGDGASDIDVQPTCGVTEAHVNAGNYPIVCSGGADDNYTFNYVDGDLTITAKPITVTANPQSKVYGTADPDLTYQVSEALESGDNFTGALTRVSGEDVGTYPITQDTLSAGSNYVLTFVGADLTITKADQTITIVTNAPASAVIGDSFTVAATASSALPVTYDSSGVCTNAGAAFTMTGSAGTCTVSYDQAGDSNYNPAPQVTENVTAFSNVPDLLTPADAEQLLNNRPTFDWTDVSGALSYTIQISNNSGFTSPTSNTVTLSTFTQPTNLPAGVTRYWRVQADRSGDPGPWSVIRSFVTASPPSAPGLASPANNALTTDYTPLLNWNDSTVPAGTTFLKYELQIAVDSAFTSPTSVDVGTLLTDSEYTPSTDLDSNTTYYWRVRAYNTLDQYSAWSAVRSFRTALLPPTLVTPTDAEQMLINRPTFEWDDVPGAVDYRIQISNNIGFTSTLTNATVTSSTYTRTSDLPFGVTLYWRVRSDGANGPSAWSEVRSLITTNPPSVPTLAAPGNNAKVSGLSPLFNWNDSTLPAGVVFDHYQIQVATDNGFTTILHDNNVSGITNSQDNTAMLASGTTYYWRVRAYNSLGHASAWSAVRSVRINFAGPTLNLPASGSTVGSLMPTFTWDAISGAATYRIQISTSSTFSTFVINQQGIASTSYTPTANLQAGTTYYWRVRVNTPTSTYAPGDWSFVFTFTTP